MVDILVLALYLSGISFSLVAAQTQAYRAEAQEQDEGESLIFLRALCLRLC